MGGRTPCLGSEAIAQAPVVGSRLPIGSRVRSGPGRLSEGMGEAARGRSWAMGHPRAAGIHGPYHPPTLLHCPLWPPWLSSQPSSHLSCPRLLCRAQPWALSELQALRWSCVPLAFPRPSPPILGVPPAAQQSRLAPGHSLADLPGTSALSRSWSLARGGGGCVPRPCGEVVGVGADSWLQKGAGGVAFGPLALPAASPGPGVADSGALARWA